MATKKEQGWEMQDRIDTELATDTSSDRNMMDYCDYYHTGKPFITLAGLMKIANEEKFTSEIYDIKNTEKIVDVVVKVTTPEGNSMYSGRTEFHRDRAVVRINMLSQRRSTSPQRTLSSNFYTGLRKLRRCLTIS